MEYTLYNIFVVKENYKIKIKGSNNNDQIN